VSLPTRGADPDATAWTHSPEGRSAAAALTAALQSSAHVKLVAWSLDQLYKLDSLHRMVRVCQGDPPICSALASLPPLVYSDGGGLGLMMPVVSTCLFHADGQEPLHLTTLILPSEIKLDSSRVRDMVCGVFGTEPVALQPNRKSDKYLSIYTAVRMGGACLTSAAVAAMPSSTRTLLRTAQRAQLQHGCRSAVELSWLCGFKAFTETLKADFELAVPLQDALAVATGSRAGALSRDAIYQRVHHAEALESVGKFAEAEVVYRECLNADARHPGDHLLMTPGLIWSYLGLCLKRQSKWAAADAAYEVGFRSITGDGFAEPDVPEWRETTRLVLLELMISLHIASGDTQRRDRALMRMFGTHIELLKARGEAEVKVDFRTDATRIYGVHSQMGWCVGEISLPDEKWEKYNLRFKAIIPLPAGQVPAFAGDVAVVPGPLGTDLSDDVAAARRTLYRSGAAKALPSLPRPICAECGAADAPKRCAVCRGPAYCDADCQKAHWRAVHKKVCVAPASAS